MSRFYRAARVPTASVLLASLCCSATPVRAAQLADRPPLGSSITVDALGLLPASENLFSLLDTVVPDVIADRIDTGGLSAGEAARVGAHGSTWTQTLFTLGDVDITDPRGTGTPLLVPGVDAWERVDVATGIMPPDRSAPGLAVSLAPRRPTARWLRRLDLIASPPALNAKGNVGTAPSIARLNTWFHADVLAAGPIAGDKLGIFTTTSATRSTHFERSSPALIDSNLASAFLNLTATPRTADEWRTIGWLQRSRDPVPNHRMVGQPNAGETAVAWHAQTAWQHLIGDNSSIRGFGGVTRRRRDNDLTVPGFVIAERLLNGPIPTVLDTGEGTDTAWSAGLRASVGSSGAGAQTHRLVAGADVTGGSSTIHSSFAGRIGETINGLPARIWDFTTPAAASAWQTTTISAYADDTIAIAPRVTLNGGLRFETLRGWRAADAAPSVTWTDLFPRGGAHWTMLNFWQLAAFGDYARYGHRLPLADLAYGDPTAPSGTVYRWNAPVGTTTLQPAAIGPLVQRVGPGTNGDPRFSAIDPALRRPHMDEVILGLEARPKPSAFVRLSAIGRRERHMIGVVDIGVPESAYSTIGVLDPGVDLEHSADDQILLFHNRSPSAFGADRYLLTNPADDETSFVGADLTGQVHTDRLFFSMGITAGRSEGLSANRGFGPLENDAGVLGEVYTNPNARDHAQGRVFTERGYTIKLAGTYRFRHDFDAGLIARYQDGQHFARLVIMEGLNQGVEAVRAFRNGRTRFTFSMTVDGRMQKRFALGGHVITAVLDAYNLFNQALEVEEFSVSGDMSRLTTAVQPPRVVQVGLRVAF